MAWDSFGKTLRALRTEAGHPSARSFYQSSGGRAYFGCTYRQYLNVENGVSAPGTRLAERVALGLRLGLDPARGREFILAYLRSLIEVDELFNLVLKTLEVRDRPPAAAEPPLRRSMVRNFKERTVPLTKDQSDCACANPENYWTFTVLANDTGRWSPARLAKTTGFPESSVRSALKALEKVRLVAADRKGEFVSPLAGKVVLHPRDDHQAPRLEHLRRNWEQMAQKRGTSLLRQHLFTLASEAELRAYFPHLIESVQAADVCSTDRQGPDTGFFLVETLVRRIMPF